MMNRQEKERAVKNVFLIGFLFILTVLLIGLVLGNNSSAGTGTTGGTAGGVIDPAKMVAGAKDIADPDRAKAAADNANTAAESLEGKGLLGWLNQTVWHKYFIGKALDPFNKKVIVPAFSWLAIKLGFKVTDFAFGKNQMIFACALGFWISLFYVIILFYIQKLNFQNKYFLKIVIVFILFWIILFIFTILFSEAKFFMFLVFIMIIAYSVLIIFSAFKYGIGKSSIVFKASYFASSSSFSKLRFILTFLSPLIYLLLNFFPVINRILQIITFEFLTGIGKRIFIIAPLWACIIVFGPVFLNKYLAYNDRLYKYYKAHRDAATSEANRIR